MGEGRTLVVWRRFARAVYRANRATRTAQVARDGDPKRIVRLEERRLLYRLFARLVNKLLR